ADRVAALFAVANVNACHLFAAPHIDFRSGRARRGRMPRHGLASGVAAIYAQRVVRYADNVTPRLQAVQTIDAAIIRQVSIPPPNRARILLPTIQFSDFKGQYAPPNQRLAIRVGDAPGDHAAFDKIDHDALARTMVIAFRVSPGENISR